LPYDSTGAYSGIINWGDGSTSINSYTGRTHTYTDAGIYTIQISGRSSKIVFGNLTNSISSLYTKLVQFGDPMQFERLSFGAISSSNHGAINMDFSEVLDIPSFAANANIDYLLSGSSVVNISVNNFNNIEAWNVSNVTSMQSCFYLNRTFNQNLNSWDVSGVTTTFYMFAGADNYNQPLNNWNVSNITNMSGMFRGINSQM
jgi:surface protein